MILKMVGAIFIVLGSKPAAEAWYDLEFSRETEPVGRDLIWLAHTIIKAKKYHNLPCGSRGHRRLGMKFKGLRARLFVRQTSVWAWSPENQECQGQEKIEIPAEVSKYNHSQLFVLSWPVMDRVESKLERALYLTQSTDSNTHLF